MNLDIPCITEITLAEGARRYVKIAEVAAEFARVDGILRTLEGDVPYKAGDAILTGVSGEHWPVSRALFDAWYRPVEGKAGVYRKAKSVLAKKMDKAFHVLLPDGVTYLKGKQGDWVVQTVKGSLGVVDDAIFSQTYRASNDFSLGKFK